MKEKTESLESLVCEIMRLALKDEKRDIFVEYSPHVDLLSVRVYENGWEENQIRDLDQTIYLDFRNAEKQLSQLLETLQEKEANK